MFGHLLSKQAQVTMGRAMPSGTVTLESPLLISQTRTLASKSTLHERTENTGFRKLLWSDACIHFRPVHGFFSFSWLTNCRWDEGSVVL